MGASLKRSVLTKTRKPGSQKGVARKPTRPKSASLATAASAADTLFYLHLRFGWWSLLAFLSLGIVLEAMHGFKIGWYLNANNEIRRLMMTLAHAHGTLISLVHLAFAATVRWVPVPPSAEKRRWASRLLMAGGILLPLGFLTGGLRIYDGDPGLGILLTPVGALFLLSSVLLVATNLGKTGLQSGE